MVTEYDNQFAEFPDVSVGRFLYIIIQESSMLIDISQQFLRLAQYQLDIDPATNFTVQLVDSGRDPQDPDAPGYVHLHIHYLRMLTAAELDVKYTIGLAIGVPLVERKQGGYLHRVRGQRELY